MFQKEHNLTQRRWLELIKDYDCTIEYHPKKANVIADALSQKTSSTLANIHGHKLPMMLGMRSMGVQLEVDKVGALLANLHIRPPLFDKVRERQMADKKIMELVREVKEGKRTDVRLNHDGTLMMG